MKSILLGLFLLVSFNSFSQSRVSDVDLVGKEYKSNFYKSLLDYEMPKPPLKRSLFIYAGGGFSVVRDFNGSFEFGTWGLKKPTSYSVTFDAVKNIENSSTFNYWIGVKPYYTFYDNGSESFMLYFAPKFKINNGFDFLIENGLSMNITLKDGLLLSSGLAFQSGKDYTLIPSLSLGLVVLLQ